MIVFKNVLSTQQFIFAFGVILFFITAAFGWEKLHYGFCFLDEGYHMTESWRLAEGDHFLKDKLTGAHRLYTLINSLIFRICPNITLLGFRKVQFFLTICCLLLFSVALFKVDKQYWYQPYIFSLFAFTGLIPTGWISNLNHYSYSHLFLTFYLSFLVLGLCQENTIAKQLMYIMSGLCLWGISLSLLHLSLIAFSPILLFLVSKKLKVKFLAFKFGDLSYVLAPFLFCWIVFIAIYNKPFIVSVFRSVSLMLSVPFYSPEALTAINWEPLKHIAISMLFLLVYIVILKKLRFSSFIRYLAAGSLLTFFVVDTSFFNFITPYLRWLSRPMWFASFIISFFILFLFIVMKKHYINQRYSRGEEIAIALFIPCAIMSIGSSFFSGTGVQNVLHSSIPATAAISNVVLYHKRINVKSHSIKLLILILCFLPFYYTVAWSDWKSTFFDVFPEEANVKIEKGFAKDIKTNRIYHDLYEWIRITSEKYAEKDDFMISYVSAPMVHMISKLRPALDDSYVIGLSTSISRPVEYYEKSIELMKNRGRHPKIAFVFEYRPAFFPISLKLNRYQWFEKVLDFRSKDPISRYIKQNMRLLEECKIHEENIVRCYVDSKMINKRAFEDKRKIEGAIEKLLESVQLDPGNSKLHYKLGNLYKRVGKLDEAIEQYEKALSIQPTLIAALENLAMAYTTKRQYDKASSAFKEMIKSLPDRPDIYYNIACIYAIQNRINESVDWLNKAIEKGYENWDLIKTDKDLENIRGSSKYKELIIPVADSKGKKE